MNSTASRSSTEIGPASALCAAAAIPASLIAQLVEPRAERLPGRVPLKLGEGRIERHEHLQGCLAIPAVIEVEAPTQGELLASKRAFAAAEDGREARLGLEHLGSGLARSRGAQFAGIGPLAVRHLLAGPEADPGHQCVLATGRRDVGVGGDESERVQRAVQDLDTGLELGLPGARQPRLRFGIGGERRPDVDDRRAPCRDGGRLRLYFSLTFMLGEQPPPLRRTERCQYEDVLRASTRVAFGAPKQVATIWRAERPRVLDLDEPE